MADLLIRLLGTPAAKEDLAHSTAKEAYQQWKAARRDAERAKARVADYAYDNGEQYKQAKAEARNAKDKAAAKRSAFESAAANWVDSLYDIQTAEMRAGEIDRPDDRQVRQAAKVLGVADHLKRLAETHPEAAFPGLRQDAARLQQSAAAAKREQEDIAAEPSPLKRKRLAEAADDAIRKFPQNPVAEAVVPCPEVKPIGGKPWATVEKWGVEEEGLEPHGRAYKVAGVTVTLAGPQSPSAPLSGSVSATAGAVEFGGRAGTGAKKHEFGAEGGISGAVVAADANVGFGDLYDPRAQIGGKVKVLSAEARGDVLWGDDGKRVGFALGGAARAALVSGSGTAKARIPIPFTRWEVVPSVEAVGELGGVGGTAGVHGYKDKQRGEYRVGGELGGDLGAGVDAAVDVVIRKRSKYKALEPLEGLGAHVIEAEVGLPRVSRPPPPR